MTLSLVVICNKQLDINENILFSLFRPHQFAHYKEDMLQTAQRAFGISSERHFRLLHAAAEEKPKIVVLSVIVQEAEGLEAKDANGECESYLTI